MFCKDTYRILQAPSLCDTQNSHPDFSLQRYRNFDTTIYSRCKKQACMSTPTYAWTKRWDSRPNYEHTREWVSNPCMYFEVKHIVSWLFLPVVFYLAENIGRFQQRKYSKFSKMMHDIPQYFCHGILVTRGSMIKS